MNPDHSQTIILGSMAVATGATVIAQLSKQNRRAPAPRIIIGGFIVTIGLLVAAEWQPNLMQGLAVLILIASLIGPNGDALLKVVTNLTKG